MSTIFIATFRLSLSRFTSYTVPTLPCPIRFTIWYFLSITEPGLKIIGIQHPVELRAHGQFSAAPSWTNSLGCSATLELDRPQAPYHLGHHIVLRSSGA